VVGYGFRPLSVPPGIAELADIRHGGIVQGPPSVLIESLDSFHEPNFDTVRQKIILTEKVLLLNFCVQGRIVFFSNRHHKGEKTATLWQQLDIFICDSNAILGYAALGTARRVAKCETDSLLVQLIFGYYFFFGSF
jgi:hypothetical protein